MWLKYTLHLPWCCIYLDLSWPLSPTTPKPFLETCKHISCRETAATWNEANQQDTTGQIIQNRTTEEFNFFISLQTTCLLTQLPADDGVNGFTFLSVAYSQIIQRRNVLFAANNWVTIPKRCHSRQDYIIIVTEGTRLLSSWRWKRSAEPTKAGTDRSIQLRVAVKACVPGGRTYQLYPPHSCCPKSSASHDRVEKRWYNCHLTKTTPPSPDMKYNLTASF